MDAQGGYLAVYICQNSELYTKKGDFTVNKLYLNF